MVVDDEEPIRTFLSQVLAQAGYEPLLARDALEAMQLLAVVTPALLLTDLVMPGLEGIELLGWVRKHYPELPVIAMSGGFTASETYLRVAGTLGADVMLEKPFSPTALLEAVARILEGRRSLRAHDTAVGSRETG